MGEKEERTPESVATNRFMGVVRLVTLMIGLLVYTGLIMAIARLGDADAPQGLDGLRGPMAWALGRGTAILEGRGVEVRVTSGYRSWEDQDRLYEQGRSTAGPIVTRARGGRSQHNYGLAVDVQVRGRGQQWRDLSSAEAEVFRDAGCDWGGDWKTFCDPCHLEIKGPKAALAVGGGAGADGNPKK